MNHAQRNLPRVMTNLNVREHSERGSGSVAEVTRYITQAARWPYLKEHRPKFVIDKSAVYVASDNATFFLPEILP